MDSQNNPLEVFYREAPSVATAFDGLVQSLVQSKGLDNKTKQLVYIGIKAAFGDAKALYFHVPMAKKAGASRDEVKESILITLTVCGLNGVASCLPLALEVYDKTA
jgi:alkylhydroperoxidase/carboxymuconolactone decarboxylase family protein YurZ